MNLGDAKGSRQALGDKLWGRKMPMWSRAKSGDAAKTMPTKLLAHWRKVLTLVPSLGRGSFNLASEKGHQRVFIWDSFCFIVVVNQTM